MEETGRKLNEPILGCSSMGLPQKLAMLLTCAIMSGAVMAGYGGVLFICAAAGILAYVMCSGFSVIQLILCGAISLGFGILVGGRFPEVLLTLVYIPMACTMRACIGKRKGLSFTVAATTVTVVLTAAAIIGAQLLRDYNWTLEYASSLYNAFKDYIVSSVNQIYGGSDISVSQTMVDALVENTVMVTPSVIAVTLMIFSYISAKICRLASIICDSSTMFKNSRWAVEMSLPATMIFAVAFLFSALSNNAVIAYSAANLMMLFLPGCGVYGLNLMFGKNSRFRRGMSMVGRIFLILLCMMSLYTGGVMLIIIAAYYACLHNVKQWIKRKMQNNSEN